MATSKQIHFLDKIQGGNFLAIQSIMENFQRHNPDYEQSTIEVVRVHDSIAVILTYEEPVANRENVGIRLESKEEFSPQALRALMLKKDQAQLLDKLQGSSFIAIQVAAKAFQQYNPDLAQYNIELVREGDSLIVIFFDKDRPEGTRGSVGKPGFEVELKAQDLQVLRSNFVR